MNYTINYSNISTGVVNYDLSDIDIISEYGLYVNQEIIFIVWFLIIVYFSLELMLLIGLLTKNDIMQETYKIFKKGFYNILPVPFLVLLSYLLSSEKLLDVHKILILKYIVSITTVIVVLLGWNLIKKNKKEIFKYLKD